MHILLRTFMIGALTILTATAGDAQQAPDAKPKSAELTGRIREVLREAVRAADDIPEPAQRAQTLAECGTRLALVGAAAEATKCFEKAHKAVDSMPAEDIKQFSLRCRLLQEIATARVQGRDWAGARATLQLLDQEARARVGTRVDHQKGMTQAFLAMYQAKAGLFDHAETTARAIDHAESRDWAWHTVAREYAAVRDWENAYAAVNEVEAPLQRANALRTIGPMEHEAGKKTEARRSLDAAAVILRGFRAEETANERLSLARGYLAIGDEKKAIDLSTPLPDHKYFISDRELLLAEIDLARKDFAAALVRARKCQELMAGNEYALRLVGAHQAKAGRADDAFKTADEIKDSWFKAQVLIDIAQAQHRAGQKDAAADTFRQVIRVVEKAPPPDSRFFSMSPQHYHVTLAQTEIGAEDQARRWALGQIAAVNQAWALLGVAEGLYQRRQQEPGKR